MALYFFIQDTRHMDALAHTVLADTLEQAQRAVTATLGVPVADQSALFGGIGFTLADCERVGIEIA